MAKQYKIIIEKVGLSRGQLELWAIENEIPTEHVKSLLKPKGPKLLRKYKEVSWHATFAIQEIRGYKNDG